MRDALEDILSLVRWRFFVAMLVVVAVATAIVLTIDASPVVAAIVFGGISGTVTANLLRSEPPPSR